MVYIGIKFLWNHLGYHLNKTQLCEFKGYRLIHIFEDEWNEITKEKLKQIFEDKEVITSGIYPRTWFSLHDKRYLAAIYSKQKLMDNNCYDCGEIKILKIKWYKIWYMIKF